MTRDGVRTLIRRRSGLPKAFLRTPSCARFLAAGRPVLVRLDAARDGFERRAETLDDVEDPRIQLLEAQLAAVYGVVLCAADPEREQIAFRMTDAHGARRMSGAAIKTIGEPAQMQNAVGPAACVPSGFGVRSNNRFAVLDYAVLGGACRRNNRSRIFATAFSCCLFSSAVRASTTMARRRRTPRRRARSDGLMGEARRTEFGNEHADREQGLLVHARLRGEARRIREPAAGFVFQISGQTLQVIDGLVDQLPRIREHRGAPLQVCTGVYIYSRRNWQAEDPS